MKLYNMYLGPATTLLLVFNAALLNLGGSQTATISTQKEDITTSEAMHIETTTETEVKEEQVTTATPTTEQSTTETEDTTTKQTTTTTAANGRGNLDNTAKLAFILVGSLVGGVPILCFLYCGIKAALQSYRDKRKIQTESQKPKKTQGKHPFIKDMKPRKAAHNGTTKYPKWQT